MNKILKHFVVLFLCLLIPVVADAAVNLTSAAHVNITSDTAAAAKNMAFKEARRQITTDVLSNYSDKIQLTELMKETNDAKLNSLISATSIDGERLSATTYSANIKMTIDATEAKKWLNENNVVNWLPGGGDLAVDQSTVVIHVNGGLRDWVELNSSLQSEKLNLDVKRIAGGQVVAIIPASRKTAVIATVRDAGWRYSNADGYLRIWK